jgi:N-acetylglucosamine-6-phosphate deacetylase
MPSRELWKSAAPRCRSIGPGDDVTVHLNGQLLGGASHAFAEGPMTVPVALGIKSGRIGQLTAIVGDEGESRAASTARPAGEGQRDVIMPGLVDLQVNGYAGVDFNAEDLSADHVGDLIRREWERGVTALCPTLISAPEEKITHALAVIAAARRSDPLLSWAIPCVHVEGPYLSTRAGARGAHDERSLRLPDIDELRRWQRAGDGIVGIVTLAPELPGALDYIKAASAQGVLVSLGHSAANSADITAAIDAGARMSTHLGNGCEQMIHRHRNPIWPQLADDRLVAGFIGDGHHLPPEVFRAMVRSKGVDRCVLVSDSVALAGSLPGRYTTPVGGRVELSGDRRLALVGSDGQILAGSASCLTECVSWSIWQAGLRCADVLRMASTMPSRLLRTVPFAAQRMASAGALRVGAPADLFVADLDAASGELLVRRTFVRGVEVAAVGPRVSASDQTRFGEGEPNDQ